MVETTNHLNWGRGKDERAIHLDGRACDTSSCLKSKVARVILLVHPKSHSDNLDTKKCHNREFLELFKIIFLFPVLN
jgi:hypothetical protein